MTELPAAHEHPSLFIPANHRLHDSDLVVEAIIYRTHDIALIYQYEPQ